MAAARVLPPRVRRLGMLLVMAVIAAALSGGSPAAAKGTPMPAGATRPDGGKPMPLAAPSQRSAVAVNRQVAVPAADTSCASGWLCMWQDVYRGGAKLAFYYCNTQNLGNYHITSTNSWRDDVSSIWNNQTGGVVSAFYDWKLIAYRLVGYLSAGNYLQDLTRDRAADGGNWNDRIDQVHVC